MFYYDGDGAVRVLGRDRDAPLLERASGGASLIEMAPGGDDDRATGIICVTIAGGRTWGGSHLTKMCSKRPALGSARI
jgi:streptomycin 6-kinase